MRNGFACCVAVTVLSVLASLSAAQPPQQAIWTKVGLTELHCNGCMKKLATQLGGVSGVGEVRGDLATKTIFVRHKPGMNPSPRAMWEAVEKADHSIIQMQGPAGTFTAKPRS